MNVNQQIEHLLMESLNIDALYKLLIYQKWEVNKLQTHP